MYLNRMIRDLLLHAIPVCVSLAATAPLRAQIEYRYSIVALRGLGGDDAVSYGINESGNVVGFVNNPDNDLVPVIWVQGGDPVPLRTFGGNDGIARDINETGDIVGWATYPGGGIFDERATLWSGSEILDLGDLGGEAAQALAISDLGHIVGWSQVDADMWLFPFVWRDGAMTELRGIEGLSGWANGLNNTGLIVGKFGGRAILWQNEEPLDLGTLRSDNGGEAEAFDVNEAGYVVGWSDVDTYQRANAFIWYDGTMYDLGRFTGTKEMHAVAINNRNQLVGRAINDDFNEDAFLWEQGPGSQRLADLIPPFSRWRLFEAWDINDAGQICGSGSLRQSFFLVDAFLMSPVFPTLTLSAPSPGTAGTANTIAVSGVTPGARVHFLYSRHGGGTRIPGCDLQQNALQLDSPTIIGSAIADANGIASITRNVPLIARGQTILFQAVVQNECAISRLVVHEFE